MPRSRNPAAYEDCRRVLDAALRANGARYRPRNRADQHTPGIAGSFVQRCTFFRQLLVETEGSDPYYGLTVRRACPCFGSNCQAPGECVGHIVEIVPTVPTGDLETLDGAPIAPETDIAHDPLLAAALAARADLFGEDL